MDLLEDLKIWHLFFSFGMIYIIRKMLVLLKNHPNYQIIKLSKYNIFEWFFEKYNKILFKKKFIIYNDGKSET